MAISFNTGATADSASTQTSSQAITVPAGVLAGDVVLVLAQQVTLTSTPSTFTASSTGTTPTAAGSPVTGTETLPAAVTGQVFWFAASASDAGKVVTITASASGFWALALVAYTGASNITPIDVISGAFGGAGSVSVTCPTIATGVANDWSVFLGGGAGENSTAVTPPAGSTLRESVNSTAQIDAVISDSNASVGQAGTNIGGGTFNSPAGSTNCILTAFTLGLAPLSGSPPQPPQPGSRSWRARFRRPQTPQYPLSAPPGAPAPFTLPPARRGPAAAVKGKLASILIKPPTTGGPPAPFFPPHGLFRGASAAVKGHLAGLRGAPGRPSPFVAPATLKGPPAAARGKLTAARGRAGQPSPPVLPPVLHGRPAARKGQLAGVAAPPPVLHPVITSPFTLPPLPLRGRPAARKGQLAGVAAPPPVIQPAAPSPFTPPRTLLRGQQPVRARTPLTGTAAPPPVPPPAHLPRWQGSTHMVSASQPGNLILGANHTGTGGPTDLKGDYERSGD